VETPELEAAQAAARPNDPAAAFELARALAELPKNRQIDIDPGGRGWRALEAIRRAIELAPDDPHAWALEVQLLGVLMHANVSFRRMGPGFQPEFVAGPLRTGRFFDELVACCEAAMARFDHDPWFPRRLADAWEFAGDLPRAVELRRRASEIEPNVTRK
jgi:tetratricopeptide (TPR) repeat protein